MNYTLPALGYSFDALEPYIDSRTMEIHYTKHHQAYVDNLCKALDQYPELYKKDLPSLLAHLNEIPEPIRLAVQNNGGGHLNHSFFWLLMKKNEGGKPKGVLLEALAKKFGSFDQFKELFSLAAKNRFGSGWAWLSLDTQGQLQISSTANQDTPISAGWLPIFGLDVWEHAYYLKYQNRRPDYISAWWNVINWDFVEDTYQKLIK